jgi:hypothetical protein
MTLRLSVRSVVVASTRLTCAPGRAASDAPSFSLTPAAGTTPVASSPSVVPTGRPSALFATRTAAAPAEAAFVTFWAKVHVPRRTSTTDRAAIPAKSAGSQPDVSSWATTASGAVSPPGGVLGENPSASASTSAPSTLSRCSCTVNSLTVNSGVCTW